MNVQGINDPTGGLLTFFSGTLKKKYIEMGESYVSESIGEQYKDWTPKDPVFIDAPTGTRKTTFIYERIIPEAIEQGRTVLLISNRIAISAQQKRKILKIIEDREPEAISHITEKADKEIIDKLAYFGPVCVTTYQGIHRLLNSNEDEGTNADAWFEKLKYVVFDEIHFLYSDALFNSCCGILLKKLPRVFRNAIRIYMTATSWEIKDHIYESERTSYPIPYSELTQREWYICGLIPKSQGYVDVSDSRLTPYRTFYDYCMRADYSAYRLHFFSSGELDTSKSKNGKTRRRTQKKYLDVLLEKMNPPPSKSDKWLVFVDKKSSGQFLCGALMNMGISTAYIDSTTKEPQSAWKSLINDARFEESVLIATPVIECGVNVEDDAVHHVAILCTDRTTFIQLLGRKRRKEGEIVDLWVWLPDYEYFEKMKNKMARYLWLSSCLQNAQKDWSQYKEQYVHAAKALWKERARLEYESLFYIDKEGRFAVDEYVKMVLGKRHNVMKQLANKYEPDLFKRVVEYWLGITKVEEIQENKADKIRNVSLESEDTDKRIRQLSRKLNRNKDKEFSEEEFIPIRKSIVDLVKLAGIDKIREERQTTFSAKTLNRYLSELCIPYSVKKSKKIWTITELQENE